VDASRAHVLRRALRPALRPAPHVLWPTRAGPAIAFVARRPSLWLIGALGFCLRGGIVLLALPMLSLPSLGEARLLIGDNLGTNGLRPEFVLQLALGAGALALLALAGLVLVARLEFESFAAMVGVPVGPPVRRLRLEIVALQLAAAAVLALAGAPLVGAIYAAAVSQITNPTGSGDIYLRVLADIRQPLAALVVAIVAVEMLVALLTRARLRVAFGLGGVRQMTLLRQPLRVIATALFAWLVSATALVASWWAIGSAFGQVRAAFLAPTAADATAQLVGQLVVSGGLALAVVVALGASGFASALRGALWNAESLA
jgi:hypothetical protein